MDETSDDSLVHMTPVLFSGLSKKATFLKTIKKVFNSKFIKGS